MESPPQPPRGGLQRTSAPSCLTLPWCLWGVLFLSACGKEAPAPPPAPAAPAPVQVGPEPMLPPVANVAFPAWETIEDETFLALPKPAKAPELKWDFSPGQRFGHEVTQTITQRIEQQRAEKVVSMDARDRNRGTFEFVAGKDKTALVVLKFHTEEAFRNGIAATRQELDKNPPSRFDAIAKEEGTAEIKKPPDRADALFFFDAVLALAEGERTLKDGWVRTKTAGFAKVGRYECVRLESEYEFAPKAGLGTTLQRGRTVAWFALAERRFIRATSTVLTSTRTKARDKEGAWVVSKVDSSSTLRIKLVESP